MKGFDLHCHFNHGDEFDTKTDELYCCNLDYLKKERDRNEICGTALCSFSSVLTDKTIERENDYLFNIVQKEKWLYQWAVIDPRQIQTFKQVEQLIKDKKVLGIKIHSIYHGYSFSDYADDVFLFAKENNSTVLMHPNDIIKCSNFAIKYGVKLINAHLGTIEHIKAMENDLIYTDTSGSASTMNNVIEYAIQKVGSSNIFFGTDTYSVAFQKGRIILADISEEDKENIMYKNASREFPQIKECFNN